MVPIPRGNIDRGFALLGLDCRGVRDSPLLLVIDRLHKNLRVWIEKYPSLGGVSWASCDALKGGQISAQTAVLQMTNHFELAPSSDWKAIPESR